MTEREKIVSWIWSVMIFGVGNSKIWEYLRKYNDIIKFTHDLKNHKIHMASEDIYKKADKLSLEDAEKVLDNCSKTGIDVYAYESKEYPLSLKAIANPPAVIFCRGNLEYINNKSIIAVSGARKPSEYSEQTAKKIFGELNERGILSVSGLANGIDRIVNETSIEKESFPIAVSPFSIDSSYPKDCDDLKKKIGDKGVIISEYFPGSKKAVNNFLKRNRILLGLSKAVIVIEASEESHCFDHVANAITQGKSVFVVPPHDIFDRRYFGQRNLLRDKFEPIFGAEDVIYGLAQRDYDGGFSLVKSSGDFSGLSEDSGIFQTEEKLIVKKKIRKKDNNKKDIEAPDVNTEELDETEKKIYEVLSEKKMLADEVAGVLGMSISDTLMIITELEIKGIIKSFPGKMYGL